MNTNQEKNNQLQKEYDPKEIAVYVNKHVGVTRVRLNFLAVVGVFIFGWLMKINYDDLGAKKWGWIFLLSAVFSLSAGRYEPIFYIGGLVIYVAAWIHTNILLTKKQHIAKEQFFKEKSDSDMVVSQNFDETNDGEISEEPERLIPVEEYAKQNNLEEDSVVQMIKKGDLAGKIEGGKWFVDFTLINQK